MTKETKNQMLLKYGVREEQILNEIDELKEEGILPKNNTDILKRGLHNVRFLADADESYLLSLLSQFLHVGSKQYDPEIIKLSKNLSYIVYSILIAKYGILKAETFDAIPKELQLIDKIITKKEIDQSEIEEDVKKSLAKLAVSIDTIFTTSNIKRDNKFAPPIAMYPVFLIGESLGGQIAMPKKEIIPLGGPTYDEILAGPKYNVLRSVLNYVIDSPEEKIRKLSIELKEKMK